MPGTVAKESDDSSARIALVMAPALCLMRVAKGKGKGRLGVRGGLVHREQRTAAGCASAISFMPQRYVKVNPRGSMLAIVGVRRIVEFST